MLNSQNPYNQLSFVAEKNLTLSEELKSEIHQLFLEISYLKGYLYALKTQQILTIDHLLAIQEIKYSMDIEGNSIAMNRLFEAYSSECYLNDDLAQFIINVSEVQFKPNQFDLKDYVIDNQINKSLQIIYRDKKESSIKSFYTNLTLYTAPNSIHLIKALTKDFQFWQKQAFQNNDFALNCILHAQLLGIAIYNDNNGFVSRLLNQNFIFNSELHYQILNVSKFIVQNKENYHRLFKEAITNNEWYLWIEFLVKMNVLAVKDCIQKIQLIIDLKKQYSEIINKYTAYKLPLNETLQVLFLKPYIKSKYFIDLLNCHRHTAALYCKHLVEMGVLIEKKSGREKLYFNKNFYDLLVK